MAVLRQRLFDLIQGHASGPRIGYELQDTPVAQEQGRVKNVRRKGDRLCRSKGAQRSVLFFAKKIRRLACDNGSFYHQHEVYKRYMLRWTPARMTDATNKGLQVKADMRMGREDVS